MTRIFCPHPSSLIHNKFFSLTPMNPQEAVRPVAPKKREREREGGDIELNQPLLCVLLSM
jgi:hypothetical protein